MVQLYTRERGVALGESSLMYQGDVFGQGMMTFSFHRSETDHLPVHTDLKLALLPAELVDSS